MEYGGSARIPDGTLIPTLKNSKTYSFVYNALGQRVTSHFTHFFSAGTITPVLTGEVVEYTKAYSYDHSGRLISESITEERYGEGIVYSNIVFLYDEGSMVGFEYTTAAGTNIYYYLRNLQGDVIAIYDSYGNKVVDYAYDSWGNCTIKSTTTNYTVAHVNPIRYRGYYYDESTGLYYLNSRYYSPEFRRFISPDDTAYLDPETPNGLNLYCYCNNDPVNYTDPSGHAPKWWQSILIGVGVIAVAALAAAAIVYTGGGAAAFFVAAGQAAIGGLKTAAVVGATAGIVRAGKTAIEGGDIRDIGKSLVLGFSDGFLSGSVYAAGSMLLGATAFRVSGLFNNGYGWSSGKYLGGYQTPKTPGVSLITHLGGIYGGRSFGLDLDIYNGLHFHTNKFGIGKKSNWIKAHHWMMIPIGIGIGVGLSDGWSEW